MVMDVCMNVFRMPFLCVDWTVANDVTRSHQES